MTEIYRGIMKKKTKKTRGSPLLGLAPSFAFQPYIEDLEYIEAARQEERRSKGSVMRELMHEAIEARARGAKRG